jgi:hypothetical protein
MCVDTPKASAPPPPQPAKKKAPGLEPLMALGGIAAVALLARRRRA